MSTSARHLEKEKPRCKRSPWARGRTQSGAQMRGGHKRQRIRALLGRRGEGQDRKISTRDILLTSRKLFVAFCWCQVTPLSGLMQSA